MICLHVCGDVFCKQLNQNLLPSIAIAPALSISSRDYIIWFRYQKLHVSHIHNIYLCACVCVLFWRLFWYWVFMWNNNHKMCVPQHMYCTVYTSIYPDKAKFLFLCNYLYLDVQLHCTVYTKEPEKMNQRIYAWCRSMWNTRKMQQERIFLPSSTGWRTVGVQNNLNHSDIVLHWCYLRMARISFRD